MTGARRYGSGAVVAMVPLPTPRVLSPPVALDRWRLKVFFVGALVSSTGTATVAVDSPAVKVRVPLVAV